MGADCRTVMLPMGQGAMNLIEIYDGGSLVSLTMIDCGGDDSNDLSNEARERSVDYAVAKMNERALTEGLGPGYCLDCLVLTHRDRDHWNMLTKLCQKIVGEWGAVKSDQIGYLEKTEADGTLRSYLVNMKVKTMFYQIFCEGGYELDASITHQWMPWENFTVNLKYIFDNKKLVLTWQPTMSNLQGCVRFSVYALDDEKEEWSEGICISSLGGKLFGKEAEQLENPFEVPLDMANFIGLFLHVYESYLQKWIIFPDDHMEKILRFLKEVCVAKKDIFNEVKKAPKQAPVRIGEIYVGGNAFHYGRSFGKTMGLLEAIAQNVYWNVSPGSEIVLYEPFIIYLYVIQKLSLDGLQTLPGASSTGERGIQNNATSIVSALASALEPRGQKAVFTGDATAHTFYQMYLDRQNEQIDFDYGNAVWTAPHHGSSVTCRGFVPDTKNGVFAALLQNCAPFGMVVSAGFKNRHGHPGKTFTEIVKGSLPQNAPSHEFFHNARDRARSEEWEWEAIAAPLYSTCTREAYRAYVVPFLGAGINAVPIEHLPSYAPSLRIEQKERAGAPAPFQEKEKEKIPSEKLFFFR